MPERFRFLTDDMVAFLIKFLPTALLGVGVGVAVKMKKEKVTIMNVITSIFIGVAVAWIFSGFIYDISDHRWHSPLIAVVAISGEKIAEYFIYKWDIEGFMKQAMNAIQDFFLNLIKKQ